MNLRILKHLAVSVALLVFGVASQLAQATVTTYTSLSSFLSNTSGLTTLDFEAQNPNGPNSYTYIFSGTTIGSVTFSQPEGRMFDFGQNYYATYGLTSSYLNQNADAASGINVSFVSPVYAVGMDLGIQNTWNGPGLGVTFSLSTGDVINTTAPLLYGTNTPMTFFGFTSDVAITSYNVNGPSQGVAFDNLMFTSSPVNGVPEPASLALLGLGLAGLSLSRRKKA